MSNASHIFRPRTSNCQKVSVQRKDTIYEKIDENKSGEGKDDECDTSSQNSEEVNAEEASEQNEEAYDIDDEYGSYYASLNNANS